MVTYRCDRCGSETTPEKLYETELLFTPRHLSGAMNTDSQDIKTLGDLCDECSDVVERAVLALVKTPRITRSEAAAIVDEVQARTGGTS